MSTEDNIKTDLLEKMFLPLLTMEPGLYKVMIPWYRFERSGYVTVTKSKCSNDLSFMWTSGEQTHNPHGTYDCEEIYVNEFGQIRYYLKSAITMHFEWKRGCDFYNSEKQKKKSIEYGLWLIGVMSKMKKIAEE